MCLDTESGTCAWRPRTAQCRLFWILTKEAFIALIFGKQTTEDAGQIGWIPSILSGGSCGGGEIATNANMKMLPQEVTLIEIPLCESLWV